MSDNCDWKMVCSFAAQDFLSLQSIATAILMQVVAAKSFKELPVAGGGGNGFKQTYSWSVEYTCPDEIRVAELRREADELERGLSGQKP